MPKLNARQAVKVWLAQHDKTQDWLALECGVSQAYLSRVLSGYRPPSDDLIKAVRRKTGLDLRDFEAVAS